MPKNSCALALALLTSCASTAPAPARPASLAANEPTELRFVEYIRASPDRVFDALTSAESTRQFFHGTAVEVALERGGRIQHRAGERVVIDGTVTAVERPAQLSYDFAFPEYDDAPTRVSYRIEPAGEQTSRLTITHAGFDGRTRTYRRVRDGWPPVLSGLKTLLETGEPLPLEL